VPIGVLGGTFDPIHLGHIASAHQVADALGLQRVLLVLCARPAHKPEHRPASIEHRWGMLRVAVEGDPLLAPSDVEIVRPGPSYTVDTLTVLRTRFVGAELYLILGIDAYLEIDTWHHPERLLERAHIVVTTRPGHELPPGGLLPPIAARNSCWYDPAIGCHLHKSGHRIVLQPLHGLPISSSEIRSRLSNGLPIAEYTGLAVANYIRDHGVYVEGQGR
jgi:nicotinate-nucleotide adenylyltransferase